jgi:hypothetical protein
MLRKYCLSTLDSVHVRLLSTSARVQANRAIVYSQNGPPAEVVRAFTIPALPAPPPQTVNVRFILSPINPADVNVIEGVYPSKPQASSFPGVQGDLFVAGNEALAEVTSVGSGVKSLQRGDWVVMKASQVGTWRSAANLLEGQLLKVPRLAGLSEVNAATMMVRVVLFALDQAKFTQPRLRSTRRLHTAYCRNSLLWARANGSSRMAPIARCVALRWRGIICDRSSLKVPSSS